uniref:Uncharacterized protein n=1 Tax=Oryza meridionalis TaxID=40149 RepID=A0A0E0FEL0_9ORYZ
MQDQECICLKNFHRAGLTYGGHFTSENFLMDTCGSMRFGNLSKGVINKLEDGDIEKDTDRFVKMIREEVFVSVTTLPLDIIQWIELIDRCARGYDDLAEDYITLKDGYRAAAYFMSLHNMFEKMETTDNPTYEKIKTKLSKYTKWKKGVEAPDGNTHLKETLDFIDPATGRKANYSDDICGLLKLLGNTRQHSARAKEDVFVLIVAQNFPRLMGDFQKVMFKQGYSGIQKVDHEDSRHLQTCKWQGKGKGKGKGKSQREGKFKVVVVVVVVVMVEVEVEVEVEEAGVGEELEVLVVMVLLEVAEVGEELESNLIK